MKETILGVRFDNVTLDEAAERGAALLDEAGFHYVVTPNPEFLLTAREDADFRRVLNGADLVLPDGVGVLYAAKILGRPLQSRVPGIDFAARMLDALDARGGRLFLLGAKPGVAEEAGEAILRRHPRIVLCGTRDGYFRDDADAARQVELARPDLLFVCLGAPRQEKWMARWGAQTGARLAIGLGGALDVMAGRVERAPLAWQKLGLEWAYRLKSEPQRIGRMARLPLVLALAAGARIRPGRAEDSEHSRRS